MRYRSLLVVPLAVATLAGLASLTSASATGTAGDEETSIAQANPPPPAAKPGEQMRPGRVFSPKSFCMERVARKAGMRAYMKVKLDLKPEQTTAWTAYEKAADEVGAKDKARCAALPEKMDKPPVFTERMAQREQRMKDRIASFEAVKAPLLALYATLTPEQKVVFDRPMMGRPGFHRGHRG